MDDWTRGCAVGGVRSACYILIMVKKTENSVLVMTIRKTDSIIESEASCLRDLVLFLITTFLQ